MKQALAAFGLLLAAMAAALAAPPAFDSVRLAYKPSEAWLLDRDGELLQTVRVDSQVRRLPWVPIAEFSPALADALMASEDRRFMEHSGVDWKAFAAAAWTALAGHTHRGASTLTMQVAGMLDPALTRGSQGRSLSQKWSQIGAARELERRWSKGQILEAYLNLVTFRGELSGIAAASRGLFGKQPSGLDRDEASLLAALLRGPNAKPAVVARRACAVRALLPEGGHRCSRIEALSAASLSGPPRIELEDQLAPHVARRLGLAAGERRRSSIDAHLQRFVQEALRAQLGELEGRAVEDGAAVVLDNRSGEVLAYVGSVDTTSQAPEVDGVQALRQAGSTLKPFLYGVALEQRLLTAASLLEDSPLVVDTPLGQYVPQDYDRGFKGWVSVRTALASSLNIPAVRTLQLLGTARFLEELRALGFGGLREEADFYGFALALGSAEVTLLDLANAYRALGNGGLWRPLSWAPHPPGAARPPGRRVLSAGASFIISDILADKTARALTFGLGSVLETRGFAAAKTGTSKDMRDNWCVGYTDHFTVAVWVGNASGVPMRDVSGVTGAAPVWASIAEHLQRSRSSRPPRPPAGMTQREVSFELGGEPPRTEWFLAGTELGQVALAGEPGEGSRMEGPGDHAVLALDPDVPAGHQRVRFNARPARPGLAWQVDGEPARAADLEADGSLLWPVSRGSHRISLHAPGGEELDRQVIRVK